jgi:hypothetical protein
LLLHGLSAFGGRTHGRLGDLPERRASSEHAERYFCGACGTGLFYVSENYLPGKLDVASATLDDPDAIDPPGAVVQTADRIAWAGDIHALPAFPRYPGMG